MKGVGITVCARCGQSDKTLYRAGRSHDEEKRQLYVCEDHKDETILQVRHRCSKKDRQRIKRGDVSRLS